VLTAVYETASCGNGRRCEDSCHLTDLSTDSAASGVIKFVLDNGNGVLVSLAAVAVAAVVSLINRQVRALSNVL